MKKMTIFGFLMVVMFACSTETIAPEMGSLDIKVTIEPLCPVEPCNKTVEQYRQIYEAYSFIITNVSTKKVIMEQKISYNGTNGLLNATNIEVGEYELDLKPQSFFSKDSFPKTFKIEKDKTTKLEILIDTGIR